MTLRHGRPEFSTALARDPESSTATSTGRAEALAFDHEHGRLYDALEHTAQLAELAGHEDDAQTFRRIRREVAAHIHDRRCGA